MTVMEAPDPHDEGPDTKIEKTLRFGCGTILGALVVLSVLPYSDVLGEQAYTLVGTLIPLACGLLALFRGKRFLVELLEFIRGLVKWV